MPRTTIWIRKEDWGRWNELTDKPAFLHNSLQGLVSTGDIKPETQRKMSMAAQFAKKERPVFAAPNDTAVAEAISQDPGVCRHGAAKGFCKFGCK